MKIAILTWVAGTSNYGSVLQAYALQEYLKSHGFDVTVLNYSPTMEDIIYPSKSNLYWKKITNKIDRTVHRNPRMKNILRRTQLVCDEFVSHNISLSDSYKGMKSLEKIANDYDVFICGSDQIWSMTKKVNPTYYLAWVPNTKIKISYAPSLPVHDLNELKINLLKERLAEFDGISVREDETAKVLRTIVDKEIESVLDPTLLVERKLWEDLAADSSADKKDPYIVCYFLGRRDFYAKGVEEIKKATGYDVKLIPISADSEKFGLDMIQNVGPVDFVKLIKNAEYVLTDSYHATIFSVIFHKDFFLFKRFDDKKSNTENIRIYDLANKLQLGDRIIDADTEHLMDVKAIDYEKIDSHLLALQERSRAYLAKHLPTNNQSDCEAEADSKQFETVYTEKSKCSGCGACHDGCPVNAIEMKEDEIGYKYPEINHDICISCGKCRRVCPLTNPSQNESQIKSYIAATKEVEKSEKSSSGGVFPLLCEKVINDGGVVYGAKLSKHDDGLFYVSHTCVDSLDEAKELYNSKYIQSNTAGIYADVKEKLTSGKKVLFSGTPCQVNGLKNYLGKDYTDLFTAEIICHGVPSHKIFHKYQKYLSEKLGGNITKYVFRDKTKGWGKNISVEFEDKLGNTKKEIIPFYKSSYALMFYKGDILRDSCTNCPFASRKRVADITLGDYWGAEYEHPEFIKKNGNKKIRKQGLSCVIVNNEKGLSMMESIKEKLIYEETEYERVALHNKHLLLHMPVSKNRNRYLSKLMVDDYSVIDSDVLNRYSKASKKSSEKNNLVIAIRLFLTNFK